VRYLQNVRMVHRVPQPGSRRAVYELPEHSWYTASIAKNPLYDHLGLLAESEPVAELPAGAEFDRVLVPMKLGPIGEEMVATAVALAVTTAQRSPSVPELPTMSEAGLPGFEASAWNGLAAPAKTPRAIVTQLNREVHAIVAIPAVKRRLRELDADARAGTSESFRDLLVADIAKWKRVVEKANIERR